MRAVLDTNILVSALLWGGIPKQLLDAGRNRRLTLLTGAALVAELEEVLGRPKFAGRLARAGTSVDALLEGYLDLVHFVHAPPLAGIILAGSRDPKDDTVLACALAATAELIVSGDQDLLTIGSFRGIRIVSASVALAALTADAPDAPAIDAPGK